MKDTASQFGSQFMGQLGQALGQAIITHDWTGVAGVFVNSISQALSQAGPGGALFGGLLSGLFGAITGRRKNKRDGQTQADSVFVHVVNHADLATQLLKATVVQRLALNGAGMSSNIGSLREQTRRIPMI